MTKETLEEIRERLLRQHNVQQMIAVRAYEIYQIRGGQPGGEAQDWFRAEGEVLAFLLADDSVRDDSAPEKDRAAIAQSVAELAPAAPAEASTAKKSRSRAGTKSDGKTSAPKKPTSKRATTKKPAEPQSKPARSRAKEKPDERVQ